MSVGIAGSVATAGASAGGDGGSDMPAVQVGDASLLSPVEELGRVVLSR